MTIDLCFSSRHSELPIEVKPILSVELGHKKKTVKPEKKTDGVPEFKWEGKNDMIVHCLFSG